MPPRIKPGQKAADFVVKMISSWNFLIYQTMILTVWVIGNTVLAFNFDPYPFILMNLFLSMQAAYTAPIILMSQKRQDEKARLMQTNDLKTGKATEEDVKKILGILDSLKTEIKTEIRTEIEEEIKQNINPKVVKKRR